MTWNCEAKSGNHLSKRQGLFQNRPLHPLPLRVHLLGQKPSPWLAKTPLTPMPFSGTQNSIKDLKSVKPSPVPGVVENSSVVSSSESSSVSSGTGAALVVILVVDVLVVLVILFLVEVMTASVVFAGIVVVLVGLLYVCESSMVSLLSWGKG